VVYEEEIKKLRVARAKLQEVAQSIGCNLCSEDMNQLSEILAQYEQVLKMVSDNVKREKMREVKTKLSEAIEESGGRRGGLLLSSFPLLQEILDDRPILKLIRERVRFLR